MCNFPVKPIQLHKKQSKAVFVVGKSKKSSQLCSRSSVDSSSNAEGPSNNKKCRSNGSNLRKNEEKVEKNENHQKMTKARLSRHPYQGDAPSTSCLRLFFISFRNSSNSFVIMVLVLKKSVRCSVKGLVEGIIHLSYDQACQINYLSIFVIHRLAGNNIQTGSLASSGNMQNKESKNFQNHGNLIKAWKLGHPYQPRTP